MRELSASTDPLEAERFVCAVLGLRYASQVTLKVEAVDAEARTMLRSAAASSRAGAHELLAVLASIGPDGVAESAQEELRGRAEDLALRGEELPPLVAALAQPLRCVGGWRMSEAYGDRTEHLALFVRGDATPPHLLMWLVDENQGGYAKDVLLDPDGAEMIAEVKVRAAADDDLRLEEADPADLHAAVRAAMEGETSVMGPAEDEDDYPLLRLLGWSRLRCLPPASALPEPAELTEGEREAILDRFLDSFEVDPMLEGRTLDDAERDLDDELVERAAPTPALVRSNASLVLDHACNDLGGPWRISPETVELFLVDWVPRKALLDPDEVRWLPETFAAWAEWVGRERELTDAQREEIFDAIEALRFPFYQRMGSGEGRSLGTQLVARFLDDGVDLSDEAQVAAAVERYNDALGRPGRAGSPKPA